MRFFQALATGTALLGASTGIALAAPPTEAALEEVVVSATLLRDQDLQHVPASVTVLDATALSQPGQQHFEDVLAQVPNLNWAGGTSRPRYFQIRGIGEREQYEGAPNPSVGFLVDDVDFSGIGMVATLFDVSQVEVLRGPQGTRLGANALAGLISIRSAEPSTTPALSMEATRRGLSHGLGRRHRHRPGGEPEFGVATVRAEIPQRRLSQRCVPRSQGHERSR